MRNVLDVAQCTLYLLGVKTIAEQLRGALTARGWSVQKLLDESGLECDRSSLQRKLSGDQKLATDEAERLAEILGCTLVWVPSTDEARAS